MTGGSNTNTGFMIPSSAALSAWNTAKTARWPSARLSEPPTDDGQRRMLPPRQLAAGTAPPGWRFRCFRCAANKASASASSPTSRTSPTGPARVGLKLIQILPINDTTSSHDWTDSYPYSAISVFALHPLYLRIEDMGYAMPAGVSRWSSMRHASGSTRWIRSTTRK